MKSLDLIKKDFEGRFIHDEVVVVREYLMKILETQDAARYLELGVHNGASFCVAISTKENVQCFGIDLFENTHDPKHKNVDKINKDRTLRNIENNNKYSNDYTLLKANLNSDIAQQFAEANGPYDIIFIDAMHDFDSVQKDFHNYEKFLKKNGFIIFDDYDLRGVGKFCDSLKDERYKHIGERSVFSNLKTKSYILEKVNE